MNAFASDRQPRHPGLVAEDRAAGPGGRRVDGEHRDLRAAPRSGRRRAASMNVDLPDAGHAADADPPRSPRRAGSSSTSSSCACSRWSARRGLDQRDRPRDGPPVAREHALDERSTRPAEDVTRTAMRSRSCAASAMTVPGREDRRGAHLLQRRARRRGGMTPPTTISTSSAPSSASAVLQRRHQREVAGGQRRDADDVHVGLHRLPGDLLRRLEQRADVDVEAEVGERGGDDLLPAVVAVLAHLGDQDARAAALGLLERRRHAAGLVQRRGTPFVA